MIPYIGALADARDVAAGVYHVAIGKEGAVGELAVASIGFALDFVPPQYGASGDVAKASLRVGKKLAKSAQKAAAKKAAQKLAGNVTKEAIEECATNGGKALGRVGDKVIVEGCFAAGTPIRTPNGATPIEDLRVGDWVLSVPDNDPEAQPVARQVVETISNYLPLLELTVANRIVRTTAEHPFWVRGRGWTPAQELKVGDQLLTDEGQPIALQAIAGKNESAPVYNVQVDAYHTYFIGSTLWGFSVWSHNAFVCFYGVRIPKNLVKQLDLPDNVQRYLLREALGAPKGFISHHLIPLSVVKQYKALFQKAARAGFDINAAVSGKALRPWRHIGSHPYYNKRVAKMIGDIPDNLSAAATRRELEAVIDYLRSALKNSSTVVF
jgi:ribosomal protein L9